MPRKPAGYDNVKRTMLSASYWLWLDHLRRDVEFASRGFVRDRRFTLSALGAIVLAVGAAAAVFGVVDRSLFRPLPYQRGERLVSVSMFLPSLALSDIMFLGAYRDWRVAQNAVELTSWSGVTACDFGSAPPQRLNCARAESTFLPLLGMRPVVGRTFSAGEDQPGADPVALISHALWRTNFSADPAIAGKQVLLDGAPTRIVGVLPADFETPDLVPADVLVPQKYPHANARNYQVAVIGRLRSGYGLASAAAALAGPFENFRRDFGERVGGNFTKGMQLHLDPLRDRQVRQYRLTLWVLLGAVAAFVLIACANVANLLLARSAGRRQEFAIRAALGGSRLRLILQLLTESALLGLVGGAAGCGLAWGLLRVFLAIAPDGTMRLRDAMLDARVLLFAMVLALVTSLLFGLARPAPPRGLRRRSNHGAAPQVVAPGAHRRPIGDLPGPAGGLRPAAHQPPPPGEHAPRISPGTDRDRVVHPAGVSLRTRFAPDGLVAAAV